MSLRERLGITYCMACGGRLREDYTHIDLPGKRVFLTDRDWFLGNETRRFIGAGDVYGLASALRQDADGLAEQMARDARTDPALPDDPLWAGSPYQAAE